MTNTRQKSQVFQHGEIEVAFKVGRHTPEVWQHSAIASHSLLQTTLV
jgi:hypothetical protein